MRGVLHTDGCCLGNPGPMGLGIVLKSDDQVFEHKVDAGRGTNNKAEYLALIAGLRLALDKGVNVLEVFLDSQLVVRQVNGDWRVKDADLQGLHREARELIGRFDSVHLEHIPRDQNARADFLSKQAVS